MSKKTLVVSGCILVALVGCARKPLTPAAPWTDVVNDSMYFLATTTDPGGLRIEYLFDWGDGQLARTTRRESGDTAYLKHSFVDPAWYEVRVQASNEKGKSSDWSPPFRFRKSQAPVISDDTICGMVRWAVNRWYHASVKVSDPDGDSVSVRFEWDGDKGGAWTAFVPSGSTITDSCLWTTGGPHTVGAVARDKGNMVARPESGKTVNVSKMAVIWTNIDDGREYEATPTLGSIAGQPVLFCEAADGIDCYSLDGQLKWRAPLPKPSGCAGSLNSDGSRLYLTDYDYGLVCLDAAAGTQKWSLSVKGGYCTPAIGSDGAVYVTVNDSDLVVKRVRDCGDSAVVEWSVTVGDNDYACGPVLDRNGVVYATGMDYASSHCTLVAIDRNGTVLWKDSIPGWSAGSPVIDSRNRILIADRDGDLLCFNPDGTRAWSVLTNQLWPNCTAVGPDDRVIVTGLDGYIISFDSTGRQQWQSAIAVYGGNTPCVAQDGVIIDGDEDYLYGFDANTGLTLWTFSLWDSLDYAKRRARIAEGDGNPSVVVGPAGDLYLASYAGLFCVSNSDLRMANTAWPTYNHDAARSGWAGRQQR